MTIRVDVRPSAKQDIAAAITYYAQWNRADAFAAALDHTFEQLGARPQMCPIVYADVRRALLRRFPFSVFFVIEPERVLVLAVRHQRRDPVVRPRR